MSAENFFIEYLIFAIFYILWPLALLVFLYISWAKENLESFRYNLIAILFWILMLADTLFQIFKSDDNYAKQWFSIPDVISGFIVFLPSVLAIVFTAVGFASLFARHKVHKKNRSSRTR